ncbi:MAG: murein DD-endopeptidase MepM/ murein hydrolase activator NlpD [Patiriisocius sp.]|jgi:murein DD-endopeptidase MepM/ murein hydrolase activator NlpD
MFFTKSTTLVILVAILFAACSSKSPSPILITEEKVEIEPDKFFGFDMNKHMIIHDTLKNNQFLSDILLPHKVSYVDIDRIAKNAKSVFDVRALKAGRPFHLICDKDSVGRAFCMIYERDAINFVKFHLGDSIYASTGEREVTIREGEASGIVSSSLFMTITEQNLSPALAMEMADIFAWTIDFYRLQKGDKFKIIYDQKIVDDEFIGIGDVKACLFEHSGEEFYALKFEQDGMPRFFDDKGQGLRKAFLKSPLKFGRLTSRYTMRRFHPVQKRNKPHLGTDYAASTGTPILATGDGNVIESRRKGGNGNYVKIKHNSTFTTQYLHMSKRVAKVGDFVRQGEVIGYVGSTGLATGPHVCYRFWKNGKQVDHLREKFEPSEPLPDDILKEFLLAAKVMKSELDKVNYPSTIDDSDRTAAVKIPMH